MDGRIDLAVEGEQALGDRDDDVGAAAARRFCLSAPHLEHLVASSRCLLAEEEVRGRGGERENMIAFPLTPVP